jgi:glycogen debranching enzyme
MSNRALLRELGYQTIKELETEQGILASGKDEIFGCIFGRDSLITSLELLKSYEKTGDPYFLALVRKILINLSKLQGKEVNIESGEEPGKCIHEFRPTDHERLTKTAERPWYIYPDNAMRNYDSVDATPLFLVAIYEYYLASKDEEFLSAILPNVRSALLWVLVYGDSNNDGLIDYRFHPDRTYGGLRTQSWMDSTESLFHEDGSEVAYPIAPVEVQAYTYAALRLWAHYFESSDSPLAERLRIRATELKHLFNEKFAVKNDEEFHLGFAIDGNGKILAAARSSMGHVLWSVLKDKEGVLDSILYDDLVPKLVERLMDPDLFEPQAGIRTLSSHSEHFNPRSYHNGSIWPHDTAMLIDGLEYFGYEAEAEKVREALMSAYRHFETPIELFVFVDGQYQHYESASGQQACKKQAWSAAALLAESSERVLVPEIAIETGIPAPPSIAGAAA